MTKAEIKDLVELFSASAITKIKIKEKDGFEIEIERETTCELPPAPAPAAPAPAPINVNVVNEAKHEARTNKPNIKSPMVGTFYQASAPGAAPFVAVGQSVKKGEVVAIIEAMKIMNEIEAEFDCRIAEILVADGQPVEFGQALFSVEKN